MSDALHHRQQIRNQHGDRRRVDQVQPEDGTESPEIDQPDDRGGQDLREQSHVLIFENMVYHVPGVAGAREGVHQNRKAEPCEQQIQRIGVFPELYDRHRDRRQQKQSQQRVDQEGSRRNEKYFERILGGLVLHETAGISDAEVDHPENRDAQKPAEDLMCKLMDCNSGKGDNGDHNSQSWNNHGVSSSM